jgi:hypothetical protein
MPNNLSMDLFVAGDTLTEVGGVASGGLDLFVAGLFYPSVSTAIATSTSLALSGTQAQVGSLSITVLSPTLPGSMMLLGVGA